LEGRPVAPADSDQEYAASVARPIRDAQALVAGRQAAVIRRLLGYLAPYRRPLTLGIAAATLITLVSLVPPYLAGYLIDRVVRPAARPRDERSRAAVLLGDLSPRRGPQPQVPARVAEVVAPDGRVVGHDARDPRRQGVQPGVARDRSVRAIQRRRDRRDQPDAPRVDDVLAAADARRASH